MNITEWIETRRKLVRDATEGPWKWDRALIADARTSLPKTLDALEKVLARHRPESFHDHPDKHFCRHCQRTSGVWPCATVQDITEALGVES